MQLLSGFVSSLLYAIHDMDTNPPRFPQPEIHSRIQLQASLSPKTAWKR